MICFNRMSNLCIYRMSNCFDQCLYTELICVFLDVCQADLAYHCFLSKYMSFFFSSVKWPNENEWMIDPVVIADIYGPEV